MRGVHIVSADEELVTKVKEALAPREVNITVSEDFPIEGSDWQPGCLSQIIPFFPKGQNLLPANRKNS